MSGQDDEFDDFLRRRKPVFRRADEEELEPSAELDRLVLRQAREAIEGERPQRVFRAPRWGSPIALAATVLIALSVVFHAGMPEKGPTGEVTVQNISREVAAPTETPVAAHESRSEAAYPAAQPLREQVADKGAVVVDLIPYQQAPSEVIPADLAPRAKAEVSPAPAPGSTLAAAPPAPPAPRGFVADAEATRYAEPPPAGPSAEATVAPAVASRRAEVQASTADLAKASSETPAWRLDAKTWLAEIERLRAAGDTARADAEMAEYNRQQRAFAGAPDR